MNRELPAVWFPAIKTGTGTDVFTERLCEGLRESGLRAEVTWLPPRAEYLPWAVPLPAAPKWANIAHVNTWLHLRFVPTHLPVLATMHLCVHDPSLKQYKSYVQSFYHRHWIRPLEAAMLRRATRVIAVSKYTARRTLEMFGDGGISVIHNGVPIKKEADPRREARHLHTPFRLLYVGNWSLRKGIDLLSPIMESLGEGFELWYTADSRNSHQNVSLPRNCKCIGRLAGDKLERFYREADALLFPTRLEGFGLVAAEALMAGLPVIASNCSSLPEIVKDGESGILCPPGNVAAFVRAIRDVSDAKVWASMGEKAARLAKVEFNLERMVEKYIEEYNRVLYGFTRAVKA